MPIFLIRGNRIIPYRKAHTTIIKNTMLVRSAEDLTASTLSRARLTALWNGLPGIKPLKKFESREIAVRRLWAAMIARVPAENEGPRREDSKQSLLIALLRRSEGATLEEMASLTGWRRHTIRAVISRTLRRRLRLDVTLTQETRGRVYRIAAP